MSNLPKRPHAVLFDFDGVILQSNQLKIDAFVEVYADEPHDLVAKIRAYQEQHGGIGRRQKFEYFENNIFKRRADNARIEHLCNRYAGLVDDRLLSIEFVAGALETIRHLQGKTELYLVSGMPETELRRVLAKRQLSNFFLGIFGSPTTKLAAFRHILMERGLMPSACLAVGDALTEYEASIQLGIPFLGIVAPESHSLFPVEVPVRKDLTSFVDEIGF